MIGEGRIGRQLVWSKPSQFDDIIIGLLLSAYNSRQVIEVQRTVPAVAVYVKINAQ